MEIKLEKEELVCLSIEHEGGSKEKILLKKTGRIGDISTYVDEKQLVTVVSTEGNGYFCIDNSTHGLIANEADVYGILNPQK